MHSSANRQPRRLPRQFPVGATYVVEGYGGEEGELRIISRYVVLPDGQRINVQADLGWPVSTGDLVRPRNRRQNRAKTTPAARRKKFAVRGGTARRHRR